MLLLSNRGNLTGPTDYANQPDYIQEAIRQGFTVKTDLWIFPKFLLTGVDEPRYNISASLLSQCLIEARNIPALEFLIKSGCHGFYRGGGDIIYTNKGLLLSYTKLIRSAVMMNPDNEMFENIIECNGLCSDFIKGFANENRGNG